MAPSQGIKQIAVNRKAHHDYFILEKLEAGIELFGTEVKSIRAGGVNLKDGRVKAEIGLCKGKKLYDKRDDMARRDAGREMERTLKDKNFRTQIRKERERNGKSHRDHHHGKRRRHEGGALPRRGPQHRKQLYLPREEGLL